jgi:hypothetical protein
LRSPRRELPLVTPFSLALPFPRPLPFAMVCLDLLVC